MIRFEHPIKAIPAFATEETPGGEGSATTIDSRGYALESIAVHTLRSGSSGFLMDGKPRSLRIINFLCPEAVLMDADIIVLVLAMTH